jgi:hypothetical protein
MSQCQEQFEDAQVQKQSGGGKAKWALVSLHTVFWVIAAVLAWRCDPSPTGFGKVIYTLLKSALGIFYIAYYLIYYVGMDKQCGTATPSV